MSKLNPLENAVIQKLLDGEHPALMALRRQLPYLSVRSREETGAGFFTEFVIGGGAVPARVPASKIRFGDVQATIPGLQHGAGFVLYIDDGLINMLEGYSYEEPWPECISEFTLWYSEPDRNAVSKNFG